MLWSPPAAARTSDSERYASTSILWGTTPATARCRGEAQASALKCPFSRWRSGKSVHSDQEAQTLILFTEEKHSDAQKPCSPFGSTAHSLGLPACVDWPLCCLVAPQAAAAAPQHAQLQKVCCLQAKIHMHIS